MLYFMKPLPEGAIDTSDWTLFIKNKWFSDKFMYFVYGLQATLLVSSILLGVWDFSGAFLKTGLFIGTYVTHELLHILVIYRAGDTLQFFIRGVKERCSLYCLD